MQRLAAVTPSVSIPRFFSRFVSRFFTVSLVVIAPAALALSVLLLSGCGGDPTPYPRDATDAALFGPASMRLHPIFTQVKDWNGDGVPDGVEALVELQDQFGDPTKASGTLIFDLYEFKKFDPQRKGLWLAQWHGDLSTLAAQRDRWNRTSRTYGFQLAFPTIALDRSYLLTAEFQMANGGRMFDQLVLEALINPQKNAAPDYGMPPIPTSQPTSAPTTGTAPVIEPGMRTPQP